VCACLDGGGPCAASPCPAAARTAYSRHAAAAPCARPHAWQLLVAMPPLSCRTHAARCCTALQPALLLAPASGTPPILAAHRPALLLTPRNCSLAVRTQRVWLIAVRRHSLSCLPPHRATLHLSCAPPHSPQQLSSSPRLPASALRSVGTVALSSMYSAPCRQRFSWHAATPVCGARAGGPPCTGRQTQQQPLSTQQAAA
jgi:hypothetical protein